MNLRSRFWLHHFSRHISGNVFKWINNVAFLRWHCIWEHHLNICDQNAYVLSRNRPSSVTLSGLTFLLSGKGRFKWPLRQGKNILCNGIARIKIIAQHFALFRSNITSYSVFCHVKGD